MADDQVTWLGRVFRTERGGARADRRRPRRRKTHLRRRTRAPRRSCGFWTARTSRDVPRSAHEVAPRDLRRTRKRQRVFSRSGVFECDIIIQSSHFHPNISRRVCVSRLASPVVAFVRARGYPFVDPPRSVALLPPRRLLSSAAARLAGTRAPASAGGRRGRRTRRPTRARETRATRETPARPARKPRRLGEDFS